jgi:hypothetical protein
MSTLKTNAIQTVAGKPILNSTGSILNVAYTEYTTAFATTTTQTYQIFYSLPVTATASNSRYLLIGNTHALSGTWAPVPPSGTLGYTPTNSRCNIGYSVTIGGATTRIIGTDGAQGESWGNAIFAPSPFLYLNRQAIYTSTASVGTTLTFNFLVAHYDPATMHYNWPYPSPYNHKSTFTIMEISA